MQKASEDFRAFHRSSARSHRISESLRALGNLGTLFSEIVLRGIFFKNEGSDSLLFRVGGAGGAPSFMRGGGLPDVLALLEAESPSATRACFVARATFALLREGARQGVWVHLRAAASPAGQVIHRPAVVLGSTSWTRSPWCENARPAGQMTPKVFSQQ